MQAKFIALIMAVAVAAMVASSGGTPTSARESEAVHRCFKTVCHWQKKRHGCYRSRCGVEKVCSTTLVRCRG